MTAIRTLTARYALSDADHRIAWTSANWDRFARENGAPELASGGVVGHPLWRYVEGAETRLVYEAVFERVRHTGREAVLPFRCDSPDLRRFMELRVARVERESGVFLEIAAELLREESRPAVDLLDPSAPRAGATVRLCSFCKQMRVEGDRWLELEDAVAHLDLLGADVQPPLSHGICPDCEASVRRGIGSETEHPS